MKKVKVFIFFLVGIALINYFDPVQYFTLENLKIYRNQLETYYQENTLILIGGYLTAYILIGLFLLPGATFLSFAAGLIFGPELGVGVVVIGSSFGAALAFLVSRYLLRDWVEKKFSSRVRGINDDICEKPLNSVLFFRLIPLFPYFAVNIGFALSQIPLKFFFFGTMFGKLPATFIYTNAGNNLATINSLSEIMSLKVLGSLSLLGILAIVPVLYKKWKAVQES
ncbi:MAG: TVP38/TMEM64 family protein [Nitrospinae bacterium]|nr:TVP38/TMEM64 family protein [Nitrospinota bacterium]